MTCIVCGAGVAEGDMTAHRDTEHPGVKKTIPLTDLYRKHREEEA